MHIHGAESKQCPPEFQARITRMFGTTEFGDPLYKVVWTQSHFIRMGNVWRDKYGNERHGYRDRYTCPTPCWAILRWRSPKEYGSPNFFYQQTYDAYSKLYFTGEYPWRGRYEVFQPMYRKEFVDNKLVVTHFPLSHVLIDKVIPLILAAQRMSVLERKAAEDLVAKAEAAEKKKETDAIAEQMMEHLPRFYGPVSFSRQGCRTSLLDRMMHKIQKQWDKLSVNGRRPQFAKGFQTGNRPGILN